MYINYRFIMASSTLALSSPPHWTKFELSGFFSNKSRSRFDFRRIQNVGVSSHYSCLEVKDVCYRPPGTQLNILNEVSFSLLEKSFGLIFGQSGSGKTTLLQLLAGLSKPTSGSFYFKNMGMMANQMVLLSRYSLKEWALCFSFQRSIKTNWTLYFLADNVLDEIIFGLPRQSSDPQLKKYLALNLVGLGGISLNKDPHSLSGGYKRRLALAIQLVQIPDLLILDEPLAGLDWKAQADVVKLLKHLKKELTILVVSHDLKELATLVDQSWRMDIGGTQREEPLPL